MRNRVRVRVERESGRVKIMNIWFQDADYGKKECLHCNPTIPTYTRAARLKSKKPLSLR